MVFHIENSITQFFLPLIWWLKFENENDISSVFLKQNKNKKKSNDTLKKKEEDMASYFLGQAC
jgi:hypothetical protein